VAKKKIAKKEVLETPKTKRGFRHLIQCRCVLPQFKNAPDPVRHKFIVFSIVDESDNVDIKYAQCNNCGIIHKITDICTSEIQSGKENASSIISIEDIKLSMTKDLAAILERYKAELHVWEQANFAIENKDWGAFVLLEQEDDGDTRQGKYLRILGENFFKIENFSRNDYF